VAARVSRGRPADGFSDLVRRRASRGLPAGRGGQQERDQWSSHRGVRAGWLDLVLRLSGFGAASDVHASTFQK
jgi:hypothetical protein